ncbi:zeta toxin family protein [Lactobacillus sp. ESL0684]|uniref:zeta toxin family protein n=1 Tax=unclassified Lactobacillus TaxID=2620435 RepID=UPI0023F82892|nr:MULTISPECIES: zeta toxin family protein [unclassified Lactobacillus]WEV39973.1 zeta toxin family protein [Lactobacillus sp. ESL0681]WEV43485.1 zeta toxin family protein [Lactobacillus sp. ESL0684]
MTLDLYIFAGINGAGKSSLYSASTSKIKKSKRANADEIARDNHWDWHDQSKNFKAMRLEVDRIYSFIENHQSFNMETTFASSKNSYLKILNKAKDQGFITHLLYVGLGSPQLAKERVQARVVKGGHGIPDKVIERRYPKSLKTLSEIISYFDTVEIYDNTYKFERIYKRDGNKIDVIDGYESVPWAKQIINKDKMLLNLQ